jgi:hypothetical protein
VEGTARFSLREGVLVTGRDEGARFVTDVDSGDLYEVNETALRILEAAREGRCLDEIVTDLRALHPEVPEATLRGDAADVLAEMERRSLLVRA